MPYKVITPFGTDTGLMRRGQVVDDAMVDGWGNKRALIHRGQLIPQTVDGCYIALKPFKGGGREWHNGDFIDLREKPWRNIRGLLVEKVRGATKKEFNASFSCSPTDLGGVDDLPAPLVKPWRDKEWLVTEYSHKTIPVIAKENGCSIGTIWNWLKKHDIERRKQGAK